MARIPWRSGVRVSAMGVRVAVAQSVVRYVDIKPTKSGSMTGTAVDGLMEMIIVLSKIYRSISVDVV